MTADWGSSVTAVLAASITAGCTNTPTPSSPPPLPSSLPTIERPTHQLLATGYGRGPEDRTVVFASEAGMKEVSAAEADPEALARRPAAAQRELLRRWFACFPRAGSLIRLQREEGETAWVTVVSGDWAGCSGVVLRGALLTPEQVELVEDPMGVRPPTWTP